LDGNSHESVTFKSGGRMCKKVLSIVLVFFFLCVAVNVLALTRSDWQINDGEGIVSFTGTPMVHGDPVEFDDANIPPMDDPNWALLTGPEYINFSVIPSTLCDSGYDCMTAGQFTYFRTKLDIPTDMVIDNFSISADAVVDGIRITIYNSINLDGEHVAFIGVGGGTVGIPPGNLVSGEENIIVITHVDDCCYVSLLSNVHIIINDSVVSTCEPPVALTKDIIVYLDEFGSVTITPASVDAGSTADCGLEGMTLSRYSFGCNDIGVHMIILTVTDVEGQSANSSATVEVKDALPPQMEGCPDDITVENDEGQCGAMVTWTPPTYSDNCTPDEEIVIESNYDPNTFFSPAVCAGGEGTLVTYTSVDESGNQAEECSFTVTVLDTETPVVTITGVEGNYEGLRLEGEYGYWDSNAITFWNTDPIVISYTVTDNCDPDSNVTYTVLWEGEEQEGVGVLDTDAMTLTIDPNLLVGNLTVTIEAKDVCGNTADASTEFTIVLKIPDWKMAVKPERLRMNHGKFTVFVMFPDPYDVTTISEARCDGAPMLCMHTCGWCMDHICDMCKKYVCDDDCDDDCDDCKCHKCSFCSRWSMKAILKFNRQDIVESLFDTHFVLRGIFVYNGKEVFFQGEDDTKWECKKPCKPCKPTFPSWGPFPWSSFEINPFQNNGIKSGWGKDDKSKEKDERWRSLGAQFFILPLFYIY